MKNAEISDETPDKTGNKKKKCIAARSGMTSGVVALQYVDADKKQQARQLRKMSTKTEKIVWEALRNRKCFGLKFRRQQIIEGFIADFYCEEVKLVVEIDGSIHDTEDQKKMDIQRDTVFNAKGIYVLRLKSEDVENNINRCIASIEEIAEARQPHPQPLSTMAMGAGNAK